MAGGAMLAVADIVMGVSAKGPPMILT